MAEKPKKTDGKSVFSLLLRRTIVADVVQGIIAGGVLAFIIATLIINAEVNAMQTTVNGWSTVLHYGSWGNNILLRAASAKYLPAANLPEEAVYWIASKDSTGSTLNGQHDYILYFPAGGSPAERCLLVDNYDRFPEPFGEQSDKPLQRRR